MQIWIFGRGLCYDIDLAKKLIFYGRGMGRKRRNPESVSPGEDARPAGYRLFRF
ncbi:MAG: hypothetical protein RL141_971 [Candidatus Parcubacteria bacterium]|jgi:hypothetical protein